MATGAWPTLADVASRTDPSGEMHTIAELLSQAISLTKDMVVLESSEKFGHEFAFRSSIPGGYWRSLNQGVPYSKSTTGKSRVGLGTLEDYSQVDRLLAEGDAGGVERFRETEDVAFLEGMGQTVEQTAWYGNTTVLPSQFMGLASFYNTVNTANAQNAQNVLNGGGTANNNTSFWLLCHGARTLHALYPRGTKAGLTMEDKSDTVPGFDSLGNRFEAYTTWFRHLIGIVPIDWRYVVRIANIDVTNAGLAGPNALDIFATIRQMLLLPPTLTSESSGITETDAPDEPAPGIRPIIYANRTGRHWMDVQAMRDRNVLLRIEDYAGRPCDGINGIPIKISDQILNTENQVT